MTRSPAARPGAGEDEISFGRLTGTAEDLAERADVPPSPDADAAAIATIGLTKRFGSQLAVSGINLGVSRGSVYGFLGPNGSGKTTTIRMLLGLIQPTSGGQRLLGVSMPGGANAVLPRVGSLVEGPAFHPQLSGRANLARLDAADRTASPRTAAARIEAALERVGLRAAAGKRYRAAPSTASSGRTDPGRPPPSGCCSA